MSGTVTDSASGAAVVGAAVYTPGVPTVLTNSAGAYSLAGVISGATITVTDANYYAQATATTPAVTAGASTTNFNFALAESAGQGTELLVNGGFEDDGQIGTFSTPTGWSQIAYSQQLDGTTTTEVNSGDFSEELQLYYVGSTVPIVCQSFTTSAPRLIVSGWVLANDSASGGSVRIRENNTTGAAGTINYYNGTAWTPNPVAWVAASPSIGYDDDGYYCGDITDIRNEHTQAFLGNLTWTKFEFDVPTEPGVTSYAIDLSADQTYSYSVSSTRTMFWDDISVRACDNDIVNGGFEDAPYNSGAYATPIGWNQIPYSQQLDGVTTSPVHSGNYSAELQLYYVGSTVPVMFQSFTTYAPQLVISGWVLANDSTSGGSMRIRENNTVGAAGTINYYNGTAWTPNPVAWISGDKFVQRLTLRISGMSTPWRFSETRLGHHSR